LKVGLTDLDCDFAHPLQREISLYAADFAERATISGRIAKLPTKYQGRKDVVWRMAGWLHFHHFGHDFFRWAEARGLRPPGTNPFTGMKRRSQLFAGNKTPVELNMSWYRELLRYPDMTPQERAVLYLLSNGLRRDEVARLGLEDIDLELGRVR